MKWIKKNMLFWVFPVTLALFVLVPDLGCAKSPPKYYVHKDHPQASDHNKGTNRNRPWETIGKANQTLVPGDTVYIREGVYQEAIDPYNSGSGGNKIAYRAYPGEEVILEGYPAEAYPNNIFPQNLCATVYIGWTDWRPKSYIVIDGFTLRRSAPAEGTYTATAIVYIYQPLSEYNEIRNCKLLGDPETHVREIGIIVSKAGYSTIENNSIDSVFVGIAMGSGKNSVVRNNLVTNPYGNCINIGSAKGQMHHYLIEGNVLCGSLTSDGIQFEPDYDLGDLNILDEDSNRGVVIRNNVICHNGENAIDLKGAAYIVIEGNIIYGNEGNNDGGLDPNDGDNRGGGHGGIMHGTGSRVLPTGETILLYGSKDVIIRNNVLYDNLGAISGEKGYKIYNNIIVYNNRDFTGPNSDWLNGRKPLFLGIAWGRLKNTSIKNNIVGGNFHCEVASRYNEEDPLFDDPDYTGLYINSNLYFNPAGVKFVRITDKWDWEALSFDQWRSFLDSDQRITGDDVDSLEADPMFVNVPQGIYGPPSEYDFNLQVGSLCIDRGMFLTRTVSQGSGTEIQVEDAGYFFNGYGVTDGDPIKVGANESVTITGINYDTNTLIVSASISWNQGDEVNLPFTGAEPDIGATVLVLGDINRDGKVDKDKTDKADKIDLQTR